MVRALLGGIVALAALYVALGFILWWQQDRLFYPAPTTHGDLPGGAERVRLQTDDGLMLDAAWYPGDIDKPAVLHFHGNGGNLEGASVETALLRENGYPALLVTYRGYGTNPGTPSEEGFYRDGRAALAHLRAKGYGPSRVIVSGNSIGSGTAVQIALEAGPAALVLTSPFTSLPDVAAAKMPFYPVRSMMRDRFDNRAKIGRIAAPTLIVHGAGDTLVPAAMGKRLADASSSADFVLVPGIGHDLTFHPRPQRIVLDWLDRQQNARSAEPAPDARRHSSDRSVQPADRQPQD